MSDLHAIARHMLPNLTCAHCTHQIPLPHRTFQNTSLVEAYWPEDSLSLSWVCSFCLHCTSYSHNQIEWISDELVVHPNRDRGFWRVAIGCCGEGCVEPIVAYTDTIGTVNKSYLGKAVATSTPSSYCRNGHGPSTDWMPKAIDFIEWTGGVEYFH